MARDRIRLYSCYLGLLWVTIVAMPARAGARPAASGDGREAVLSWLASRSAPDFPFTIVYLKRFRQRLSGKEAESSADLREVRAEFVRRTRDRLESMGALHRADVAEVMDEFEKRSRVNLEATLTFLEVWGTSGLHVEQRWRAIVTDEETRIDLLRHASDPAHERYEAIVKFEAFHYGAPWRWDRLESSVPPLVLRHAVAPEVTEAQWREIEFLIEREEPELAPEMLGDVHQEDGTIVARFDRPAKDSRTNAQAIELEFELVDDSLVLKKSIIRSDQRYVICSFNDYRDVNGILIAFEKRIRSGPILEMNQHDHELFGGRLTEYRIVDLTSGLSDEAMQLLEEQRNHVTCGVPLKPAE